MATENTQIETPDVQNPIQLVQGSMQLQTVDDSWRASKIFFDSGIAPAYLDTRQKIFVVLQAGAEHGFKPWQSLQIFHVINGRVGMDGAAMLAKIRKSRVCEYIQILFEGAAYDDKFRVIVRSKRRNESVQYETDFSVADAKVAKLWGTAKDNWAKYPKDMLTWRAVSRHARRYYSDEISAMYTPDELEDIESMPLSFEASQAEASERIAAEAGSEPVDAQFEEPDEPEKKAGTKSKKKAKKKVEAKEVPQFKWVCKKCGAAFDEPRPTGPDGKAMACPNIECGSLQIERQKPEFMED